MFTERPNPPAFKAGTLPAVPLVSLPVPLAAAAAAAAAVVAAAFPPLAAPRPRRDSAR